MLAFSDIFRVCRIETIPGGPPIIVGLQEAGVSSGSIPHTPRITKTHTSHKTTVIRIGKSVSITRVGLPPTCRW